MEFSGHIPSVIFIFLYFWSALYAVSQIQTRKVNGVHFQRYDCDSLSDTVSSYVVHHNHSSSNLFMSYQKLPHCPVGTQWYVIDHWLSQLIAGWIFGNTYRWLSVRLQYLTQNATVLHKAIDIYTFSILMLLVSISWIKSHNWIFQTTVILLKINE